MKRKYIVLLVVLIVLSGSIYAACMKNNSKFTPEKKYPGACKIENTWFDKNQKNEFVTGNKKDSSFSEILGSCDLDEYEISYTYDKKGNPIKIIDIRNGEKTVTEKKYNKKNTLVYRKRTSVTNGEPWISTIRYRVNKKQQILSVKKILEHHGKKEVSETKISHPSDNESIMEESGMKMKIVVEKDKSGNVLKETKRVVSGDTEIDMEEKHYKYDSNGNLIALVSKYTNKTSEMKYNIDRFGNILSAEKFVDGQQCPTYTVNDYACWEQ